MSAWSLLDTSVASAQLNRSRLLGGLTSATAAANRSVRPGPTGRPAWRSAAPNRADSAARSSAIAGVLTGHLAIALSATSGCGVTVSTSADAAANEGSEVRAACGPQVLRVLQHRAHRLPRRACVQIAGPKEA